jgi:hypothetical protein
MMNTPQKKASYFKDLDHLVSADQWDTVPHHEHEQVKQALFEMTMKRNLKNSQTFHLTDRYACLSRNEKTLCTLKGITTPPTELPATAVEFMKKHGQALQQFIAKAGTPNARDNFDKFFEENGGFFCAKQDIGKCEQPTLYIKNANPPYVFAASLNAKAFDQYTPLLVKEIGWFPFQYRYLADMFFFPWIVDDLFNMTGFNRLVFSHGLTEVLGGAKDTALIAFKILRAFKLHHSLQRDSLQTDTQPAEKPLRQKHKRAYREPGPKKDKSKTKGEEGVPSTESNTPHEAPVKSSNEPKALPPALQNVLDPHIRSIKDHELKEIINELSHYNIVITPTRDGFFVTLPGHVSFPLHPPHRPGKGTKDIQGGRLHDLKNLIKIIQALSQQPVFK